MLMSRARGTNPRAVERLWRGRLVKERAEGGDAD